MHRIAFNLLIASGLMLWAPQGWTESLWIQGAAIEIEDGDTLRVSFAEEVKRIQLIGIDAPEDSANPKFNVDLKRTGMPRDTLVSLGVIATEHLQSLIIADQRYELRYDAAAPDKYGRIPGELFTPSGQSINARMVDDGYAITLPNQGLNLLSRQQMAEQECKGLWGLLWRPTRLWAGVTPTL